MKHFQHNVTCYQACARSSVAAVVVPPALAAVASQLWKSSLEFKAQAGKLSAPAPSCSGQGGGQGDGQGPAAGLENIMFAALDRIQCHLLTSS